MKTKLLFFFLLGSLAIGNAQCGGVPPPPGINNVWALDMDNDGYATFDIGYYITAIDRPIQESIFGVSSSGYDFVFYNSTHVVAPLLYTNIVLDEYCSIHHEYNGNGPTFDPQPPCYWPVYATSDLRLVPIPYNQDFDGDGILNVDEDTNNNRNLMDDDEDQDGIVNFRDSTNTLGIQENSTLALTLYPNPTTDGIITFESNVQITEVTAYDIMGKQLLDIPINSNTIRVDSLAAGSYFLKFQSENNSIIKKIVITR